MNDIPALGHLLLPAQHEVVQGPLESLVDQPQEDRHGEHEGEHDQGDLGGFLSVGPDDATGFGPGVLGEREEPLAGPGGPRDGAADRETDEHRADAGDRRLTGQHVEPHQPGDRRRERERDLDPVGDACNGFDGLVRHALRPGCAALLRDP